MNTIKRLFIIVMLLVATTSISKAQDYGKLEYWGKSYNLDRSFFEFLNQNMDFFTKVTAPQWKWYDIQDYSNIYVSIVNYLKNTNNVIIVTEANQLQFRSNTDYMPGQINEIPTRSKKSAARAVWVLINVVLPSLQQFEKQYENTHQFQQ